MINQKNKSRAYSFGASDTHFIMGNWDTATFMEWWQTKIGAKENKFKTVYTLAGTYKEHQLADWYAAVFDVDIKKDRKIKVKKSKLVVNLDFETNNLNIEVKTYRKTDKEWKLPISYWQQTQVQTYASGKPSKILAYALEDEDYDNFYLPIDEARISFFYIDYDKKWIEEEYLPRLKYLERCLKTRKTPKKGELKCLLEKK